MISNCSTMHSLWNGNDLFITILYTALHWDQRWGVAVELFRHYSHINELVEIARIRKKTSLKSLESVCCEQASTPTTVVRSTVLHSIQANIHIQCARTTSYVPYVCVCFTKCQNRVDTQENEAWESMKEKEREHKNRQREDRCENKIYVSVKWCCYT